MSHCIQLPPTRLCDDSNQQLYTLLLSWRAVCSLHAKLIFTAQWTRWHKMLCVMYTLVQKAALLSGIFPLKVHYKDGWWVHASSRSSSSSLSLSMLIVMTVIIVIFILLIIMMIIIGCPCALPRERLGVCDQWRQQGGIYSLQVGLTVTIRWSSVDHYDYL